MHIAMKKAALSDTPINKGHQTGKAILHLKINDALQKWHITNIPPEIN